MKGVSKIAEVRGVKDLNARFCVVDGKEVLFMLMDDKEVHPTYDSGVWVNTPYFASPLENLFETTWKNYPEVN